jgi:hypothetical protein
MRSRITRSVAVLVLVGAGSASADGMQVVDGPHDVAFDAPVLAAAAQPHDTSRFRLQPAVIRTDDGGTAGLRWELPFRRQGAGNELGTFPVTWFAKADTRGTVAAHRARNPESIIAAVAAGTTFRYHDVLRDIDTGFFELGGQASVDTDQAFDVADLTVGAMLSWINTRYGGLAVLLPSFEVTAGAVKRIAADDTDGSSNDDWRRRFAGHMVWHLRADQLRIHGPLGRLSLHLHGRGFTDNTAVNAGAGSGDGTTEPVTNGLWGAAALAYRWDRLGGNVFVRYSQGTLPAAEERPAAISAGLDLPAGWLGRLLRGGGE